MKARLLVNTIWGPEGAVINRNDKAWIKWVNANKPVVRILEKKARPPRVEEIKPKSIISTRATKPESAKPMPDKKDTKEVK